MKKIIYSVLTLVLFIHSSFMYAQDEFRRFRGQGAVCLQPIVIPFIQFCVDTEGSISVEKALTHFITPLGVVNISANGGVNPYRPKGPDDILVIIRKHENGQIHDHTYNIEDGSVLELHVDGKLFERIERDRIFIEVYDNSKLQVNFSAKEPSCATTLDFMTNPIGFLEEGGQMKHIKTLLGEPDDELTITETFIIKKKRLVYKYRGEIVADFKVDPSDNGSIEEINIYQTPYTAQFFSGNGVKECLTQFLGKERSAIEYALNPSIKDLIRKSSDENNLVYRTVSVTKGYASMAFHTPYSDNYSCRKITISWEL
ncbi:MAG: hypothetical protein R3B93_14490 [Bacteroidia bacterium]